MKRLTVDPRVMDILTEEEIAALSLQYIDDKSSWESGTILGKAHYKYLEIKQRAEVFFKMFTEYFNTTAVFIPDIVPIDSKFKEYIQLLILKRYTLKETLELVPNSWKNKQNRYEGILENMMRLSVSSYYQSLMLFNLIIEFDRWNNFRILPPEIQKPSPYKRRLKNELKLKINNMLNITPLALMKVLESYTTTNEDSHYMPICKLSEVDSNKLICKIYKVEKDEYITAEINKYGLYTFQSISDALEFINTIKMLFKEGKRSVVFGQKFWPEFRKAINNSIKADQTQSLAL